MSRKVSYYIQDLSVDKAAHPLTIFRDSIIALLQGSNGVFVCLTADPLREREIGPKDFVNTLGNFLTGS